MVVRYEERGGRGRCVDGAHWANTGKPPVPRNPTLVSFGRGPNKTKFVIKPPSFVQLMVYGVCSNYAFDYPSLCSSWVASGLNW